MIVPKMLGTTACNCHLADQKWFIRQECGIVYLVIAISSQYWDGLLADIKLFS
jgi:hypothetical protein